MKQLLVLFIMCGLFSSLKAAQYNVNISGFSYSPATLTVNVGDVVIIQATNDHPLIQVSLANWNANNAVQDGFGSSSDFTLNITAAMAGTTIYYGCSAHFGSGMKGQINVNVVSGISENRIRPFNFTVYPNPVTADSWMNVSVKTAGKISITVYDLNGRVIRHLIDQQVKAGEFTLPFPGNEMQKGTYIVQMRTAKERLEKQILIR
ncbi:cupredoxin domain-containing protein [Lacibacter sediminis]|uniref:T9SS type A sorting domain-containing protein n=1 Tax=Lacibacter sediminis TaxID=2760713 RepID=A0A7G5XBG7_9BACT|nr:T9SS type A sorting domain-containing protein [Lacibacter sediminis]QNA42820.1 T9SS type A sorting domain-containing protein [Lacibacter sediminis]